MSKASDQFYAIVAEKCIEDTSRQLDLLLKDRAIVMACWQCGKDTLHERTREGWRCIYHYSHKS